MVEEQKERIMTEDEAEIYWTTYLLYKYEFLQSDWFKKCENHDRCKHDNLHYCGCFGQYLQDRNQMTIRELEIAKGII